MKNVSYVEKTTWTFWPTQFFAEPTDLQLLFQCYSEKTAPFGIREL